MDRVLDEQVKPLIKRKAVDPYQPLLLQSTIHDSIDMVWPDIKEVGIKLPFEFRFNFHTFHDR
jgi:hypothetical protein